MTKKELASLNQPQGKKEKKHYVTVTNRSDTAVCLTPVHDLRLVTRIGMSMIMRKEFKNELIKQERDIFAATNAVSELKKRLVSHAKYEWINACYVCTNGADVINHNHRIRSLYENGRLCRSELYNSKIYICLLVDKGGDKRPSSSTKFGFTLGNVEFPNFPDNFSIFAYFEGGDSRSELETKLQPVLEQLKQITYASFQQGRIAIE